MKLELKGHYKESKNKELGFFSKIKKIVKSLSKLTKRKTVKIQSNKIKDKKGVLKQVSLKSSGSLGSILKTYIQINGKI
jgi:hypothetical protein